jgi:hypothetical protein
MMLDRTAMAHRIKSGSLAFVIVTSIAVGACANRQARNETRNDRATHYRTVLVSEPAPHVGQSKMFACDFDEDCVVLELGCCDHCNGGSLVSVGLEYLDEVDWKFRDRDCTGECTQTDCGIDFEPVCDDGVCARVDVVRNETGEVSRNLYRNQFGP